MSTLQFKRMARLAAPRPPGGEVHLEPPPEIPRAVPGNIVQKILPAFMIVASLGMMVFMLQRAQNNPMMMMMPMMMLVSTVGMMAGGGPGNNQKKSEMNEDRKDYLRYLGQMRDRAREAADEQRLAREWVHPDPQTLWSVAGTRRMWERRPADNDFCQVRVGRGSQRLETRLVPPQTGPVDELEPITTLALRRFVRAHSLVPDLPIATSLRGFAAIGLQGDRELTRAVTRAILCQLATFHTPDDVLIAVASAGRARGEWDWVKWLPHAQHPTETDGVGPVRLMSGSLASLEQTLAEQLAERQRFQRNATQPEGQPHIVVVIDDAEISRDEQLVIEGGLAGVTMLDLSDSLGAVTQRRGMRMVVEPERIGARGASGVEWFGAPDAVTMSEANALARRLAPYRPVGGSAAEMDSGGGYEPLTTPLNYVEQLGMAGDVVTFDLNEAWRPKPVSDLYRVAIGPGETGEIVHLDIKETASGGMGPHGLCIGATGSGKSEFLRTIVLGMMATHSSDMLNFVLVDYKGGATFNGFESAPHVSASISNLEDNSTLIDRMYDALSGEMNRRQEVLNKAGAKNVWDYRKMREAGDEYAQEPLPALFVVIDEFSELLAQQPEFAELFVMIGRLGRSLQVHLLLASQRLEEGKLRGLDAHLSYRIGLKTFNAAESRAAIGVPDAADLPATGGHGYLKHPEGMDRFRAAYVSGHLNQTSGRKPTTQPASPVTGDKMPRVFIPDYIEKPPEPEQPEVIEAEPPEEEKDALSPTDFQIVIDKLWRSGGPQAHQVWLPPLDTPPTLDTLLPPLQQTDDRGYTAAGYAGSGRLQVPVGLIDVPYHQRQDLLMLDLNGAAGHGAIAGAPQAGKSAALRTMIAAMALTHTPEEVQFYCVDLGGGSLVALRNLPHVGSFGGPRDQDTVRRTVAEVKGLIAEREARFQALGIDSMADFRTRKRRGEVEEDPYGDVFLVIDGWGKFRADFESLEQDVMGIAAQGLTFGVHLFVTANRWADIRPAMKDLMGTRLELRLGDSTESEMGRKVADKVPANRPGRGLHSSQLHFLTALPRVDSENIGDREGAERDRAEQQRDKPRPTWELYNDDLADGVSDLVNRVRSSWKGEPAPQVRLLPDELPYDQLPRPEQQPSRRLVPVGVNEEGLRPVYLDFDADPHFYAFGERESGKTSLLRGIVRGITERYTPKEALILLVDYRRTMLGLLNTGHLLEYAVSADQLKGNVRDVSNALKKRLPGPNVTQEQLKNRSWWSGPELFVIVDDYELVAPQGNNPLAPLAEYVAQATDVGLHVVLARNSGGANRALFEPIIGKMREVSAPGLAMSANKDDGQLVGNIRSRQLPAGRGTLVSRSLRGGPQLIQTAHLPQE